ncbi:hypothetical protein Tco_1329047 [Tanacetum coccineum]
MSRANPQAAIIYEQQLVPSANRLIVKKNNQHVASDSNIIDSFLRLVVGILIHHKLYKPLSLTANVPVIYLHQCLHQLPTHHIPKLPKKQILTFIKTLGYDEDQTTKMTSASTFVTTKLHYASLIWDEFEWQAVDRTSRPSKMSKLIYTRFTKLIIDHFLSCNKSIPRRSDAELHSEGQDSPLTKLINTVDIKYKFGMEIPDSMIIDAIKLSAGYKFYKQKKSESEIGRGAENLEEHHVCPIKSGRGKGYMRLGDQEVNVPKEFKKNVIPRKQRSITFADNLISQEDVAVELAKSISIEEQRLQQRDITTQLTNDRKIEKDVEDTYAEWGQKLKESNMSRANPQAAIVSEEQLVPSANRLIIKKNNQRVASDSNITDSLLRLVVGILIHHKLYKPLSLTATVPSIPRRSDAELHSEGQDSPLTKLINTVDSKYKFGMEIPDSMIIDAIKHGRGKGYMRLGDQEVNVPKEFKKNAIPRKQRSITFADNLISQEDVAVELAKFDVEDTYAEWGQKLKGLVINDPTVQSLLVLRRGSKESRLDSMRQEKQPVRGEGSSAAHDKYYEFEDISVTDSDATQDSSRSDNDVEKEDETDDSDDYDMDLSDDEPKGDDDVVGFRVLLNEPPTHELTDFMRNLVYTDAHTTSVVTSLEGNPEKLEALTSINVSKVIEKAAHAKVLIEMKKLLPTHVSKVVANYVKPRLNKSVREAMKNNQINLFTKPSTNIDDLSEMELKLKLLNIMQLNKSYETHSTHQQLYNTLYNSVTHQEALAAQDAEPSFYKMTHDDQDPLNDREEEKRKKRRKDVGEPSSRASRKEKTPVVPPQENTPTDQPQDQEDVYVQEHFDQNKHHILRPSTVAIAKKLKELIQKDELTIADLKGAGLEKLKKYEGDVSKPRSFESHMSKSMKPHPSFYNNDFYYSVNLSTGEKYATSLTKHYIYAARYHIQDDRQDFFKAEINNRPPDKVYSDKRIISVVRVDVKRKWGYGFLSSIVVRRSDKKEYTFSYADLPRLNLNDIEDMYLLKVQDKLHHLRSEFDKDFNNALLLSIRRTVILNIVEDLQLGVESYQRTLNLTKPKIYFEGIKEKIAYTMSGTEKGVVYLNQHNRRSLMKLNEVHKFYDGTLMKIRDNLLEMINKNELGQGNKRLKGRD